MRGTVIVPVHHLVDFAVEARFVIGPHRYPAFRWRACERVAFLVRRAAGRYARPL